MNAAQAAEQIRDLLTDPGAGDSARLRVVRQFIMDVEHASRDERMSLLNSIPPSTGDIRWDALLAGVTEDLAFRLELRVPRWALTSDKFLRKWWFVSPFADTHATALRESPAALANRGVFLRRASLENV
jgi:hypothetical protein